MSANPAIRATMLRLTPDEVCRIIQAATCMRDALLVVVLYTTGIRNGELRGLWHEDINVEENIIYIKGRETHENGARVKGQNTGRGFRSIPVPEYVMKLYEDFISSDEYLAAFESGTNYVFCNIKSGKIGRGLTANNLKSIIKGLCRRASIQMHPHMLRHTHASEIIAQGHSLIEAADRLGHRSPQTTNSTYKHLFDKEIKKSIVEAHSGDNTIRNFIDRAFIDPEHAKWA